MITQPLELQSRLSPPPRDLDMLFWVNVGAVVLFFSLLGSRFVLAPGVSVQVGSDFMLPLSGSATQEAAPVVVSYRRDNMVLFEGEIFETGNLRPRLEEYAKNHPGSVMLVRCDKAVSMQGFLKLCDLAKTAGFASVLVAAEPPLEDGGGHIAPLKN